MSINALAFNGISITVEMVTPVVAKRWLTHNDGNRRLRSYMVEQYAHDMTQGDWLFKPVAICFDEKNKLANGQHTLSAILKSGIGQTLLIARHMPRKNIAVMDRGLTRSINDIAQFLGEDFDSKRSALARVVKFGLKCWANESTNPASFDTLFSAYMEHKEPIDFVLGYARQKSVGFNAPTLAVCARAYYTESSEKIGRFLEVLRSGVVANDGESAAIRLRDFQRTLKGGASTKARIETYQKTQSALRHFLDAKPISKIYGVAEELFEVPDAAI
jgi:arylamine N-acetyltransferase